VRKITQVIKNLSHNVVEWHLRVPLPYRLDKKIKIVYNKINEKQN